MGRAARAAPGATASTGPGLRERKAAATRLAIEASLRTRLETTLLADISVDDLAADAGVSRMTFFNYFPSKDHAVDFLMMVWMFRLEEGIGAGGLRGVAGLEAIFAWTGDEMQAAPERIRRVHAHFACRPQDRPLPLLTEADRLALSHGKERVGEQPVGLGRLFMRLCAEAAADGEIVLHGSTYELAHMLGALMHGASAIGHSSPDTDWRRLFRRHVRRALGLLGVDEGADPPPARVPAHYRGKDGVARAEASARKAKATARRASSQAKAQAKAKRKTKGGDR